MFFFNFLRDIVQGKFFWSLEAEVLKVILNDTKIRPLIDLQGNEINVSKVEKLFRNCSIFDQIRRFFFILSNSFEN